MEAEAIELGSIGTRARCQALAVCMGLAVLGCVTGCNRVTLVSGVSPLAQVAVKLLPVALGPTVTESEAGENVQPLLDGVTV